MKLRFEVVGRQIAEGRVAPFGVEIYGVVANSELGFYQARKAAAVERFGSKAAPKRFGLVVAIAPPAPVLLRPVAGQ